MGDSKMRKKRDWSDGNTRRSDKYGQALLTIAGQSDNTAQSERDNNDSGLTRDDFMDLIERASLQNQPRRGKGK